MAYLKNDYKLMYENREVTAAALTQHIRATKTVPALSDPNVTYKKADGTTVDPKTFKFITEKNGCLYGSVSGIPAEATVKFSVYSGGDLLLGDPVSTTVNLSVQTEIEAATPAIYGESDRSVVVERGTAKTALIFPESGYAWKTAPTTCKINGVSTPITSTAVGNVISIGVTVNDDTVIDFDSGETEVVSSESTVTVNKDTTKTTDFNIGWNFYGLEPSHQAVTKIVNIGDTVRIYVEPDWDSIWDTEPTTCKVNGVDTNLTKYGESASSYFYIDLVTTAATESVIFDTGSTRLAPVSEA